MRLAAVFRSNTAVVVFESLAVSLLGFATYSVLLRVTDKETVGTWVLAGSLIAYSRIADMWSNGLTSFVGEERGKADPAAAASYVTTAAVTGMIGYLLIMGISFPLLYFGSSALFGPENLELIRSILPLMLCIFWLQSMASVYQLGLLGFDRPGFKVTQTVGGALIFLIAAAFLAPKFGLKGILYAQAGQGFAMLAFAIFAYHGIVAPKGHRGFAWDRKKLGSLFAFGSKMTVVGLFQNSIEPLIRVLVSQFGSLSAVAIVDLAARLIAFVRAMCTSLGQILVPGFARLGQESEAERLVHFQEAQRLFLYLAVAGFSALIVGSALVGTLVLGHADASLPIFATILGLGWLANTLGAPSHFLLLSLRRPRILLIAHVILAVGGAVLGSLAGMAFGVYGALAGAAISLGLTALYMFRQSAISLSLPRLGTVFRSEARAFVPLGIALLFFIVMAGNDIGGMNLAGLLGWTAAGTLIVSLALLLFLPVRRMIKAIAAMDRRG